MKKAIQEIMNDINNQNYVIELMHKERDSRDAKINDVKLRAELEVEALNRETNAYMRGAQDMQNHIYFILRNICESEGASE